METCCRPRSRSDSCGDLRRDREPAHKGFVIAYLNVGIAARRSSNMKMPTVKTEAFDAKSNVTYKVLAYRKLTKREVEAAIVFSRSGRKKKPKAGTTVTICSTIE
jgi:hypothetical protein